MKKAAQCVQQCFSLFDIVNLSCLYFVAARIEPIISGEDVTLPTEQKMLDDRLAMRINSKDKQTFQKKCDKAGRQYQEILREVIVAFNENRLRIKVPKSKQQPMGDLYVTGK